MKIKSFFLISLCSLFFAGCSFVGNAVCDFVNQNTPEASLKSEKILSAENSGNTFNISFKKTQEIIKFTQDDISDGISMSIRINNSENISYSARIELFSFDLNKTLLLDECLDIQEQSNTGFRLILKPKLLEESKENQSTIKICLLDENHKLIDTTPYTITVMLSTNGSSTI